VTRTALFPASFNSSWENKVLLAELEREGNIAWYRNPARASQDSLGVTYEEEGGETKIVRPDFIFFARLPDSSIVADIVDPHGYHLADALPKLQGLARYAETNAEHFRRIEAVTAIGNGYKVLDISEPAVRAAIHDATNAKTLYESSFATEY
jgi:type III restriction enzyme